MIDHTCGDPTCVDPKHLAVMGVDLARNGAIDRTFVIQSYQGTLVTMRVGFERFNSQLKRVTEQFEVFAGVVRRMKFKRVRHRSGHRHRGTVDWKLRYAPARKDVTLGMRTQAKRDALHG